MPSFRVKAGHRLRVPACLSPTRRSCRSIADLIFTDESIRTAAMRERLRPLARAFIDSGAIRT
jgi:hypothetical protein